MSISYGVIDLAFAHEIMKKHSSFIDNDKLFPSNINISRIILALVIKYGNSGMLFLIWRSKYHKQTDSTSPTTKMGMNSSLTTLRDSHLFLHAN